MLYKWCFSCFAPNYFGLSKQIKLGSFGTLYRAKGGK